MEEKFTTILSITVYCSKASSKTHAIKSLQKKVKERKLTLLALDFLLCLSIILSAMLDGTERTLY